MSVDPIKVDNPLNRGEVPPEPMSIGLVPRSVQLNLNQIPREAIRPFFSFVMVAILLLFVFLNMESRSVHGLAGAVKYQPAVLLALGIGCLARFADAGSIFFLANILLANVAGLLQAAIVKLELDPANRLLVAYLAVLTCWTIVEFLNHYSSIDLGMNLIQRPAGQDIHGGSVTLLLIVTIIGTIGMSVLFLLGNPTFAVLITSVAYCYLSVSVAKTKSKSPYRYIWEAIKHYYLYPDGKTLAPGLIKSSCGSLPLRPLPMMILLVAFVLTGFAIFNTKNAAVAIAQWFALSMGYVLSVVMMGAAFSAQPHHFPSRRVPHQQLIDRLRTSNNPDEKLAYFWGQVEVDLSPIIISRDLVFEHMHLLGSTGRGKSALRLAPLIEQTIGFGDMSLIIIDLKADKLEALASCLVARDELKNRTGVELPIKLFTLKEGDSSHIFNPFVTEGWQSLSVSDRTTVLAEALNLHYGTDWSRGHFSAVNADIIGECLIANPNVGSFHELYQTLCNLAGDDSTNVGSQRRSEYVHVAQTIQKIASCSVLNATESSGATQEELEQQINLADAFRSPGIYYFNLPSTTSPFVAQTVGRLVAKFLLMAAKSVPRTTRVQIIIDEFQRMVSENLDGLFQLARSHDISLVIANQSLGDLRSTGEKLIQAIEGNCAIRQWLSVNSISDIELVSKLFGTHKELDITLTSTPNGQTVANSWRDAPRITTTNLHQISSDPFLSLTQITGARSGYAQYGGVPFVIRNSFHISQREYKRRGEFKWPTDWPGLIQVTELPQPQIKGKKKHRGKPINKPKPDEPNDLDDLFS